MNEKPIVEIEGHDNSGNTFGHAVVMTQCVLFGTTVEFKLKNSFEGAHLRGTVSLSQISSNEQIQLTEIRNSNRSLRWTMSCYLTWFAHFSSDKLY